MKHDPNCLKPPSEPSSVRWSRLLLAGLTTVCTGLACSGQVAESEERSTFETRGDELQAINNPEFKNWSPLPSLANGHGTPALCSNAEHSYVAFSRDTSGVISGLVNVGGVWGAWSGYGTRKFKTRPACASVDDPGAFLNYIVVARGLKDSAGTDDTRLFWSAGEVDGDHPVYTTKANTMWTAIGPDSYTGNTGSPAIAYHADKFVVTFLGSNNRLYAHFKNANGAWSNRLAGPVMPTGWTATGTPAITFVDGWLGRFMVVVRAVDEFGKSKLYYTFFSNENFSDLFGQAATYTAVPLASGAPVVDDDPGLEYDSQLGVNTLYYRSGSKIYQTSGYVSDLGQHAVESIRDTDSPTFGATMSVLGGINYEPGRHWVLARNNATPSVLYFAQSGDDAELTP